MTLKETYKAAASAAAVTDDQGGSPPPPIQVEEFSEFLIDAVKLPPDEPGAPPLDEEAIKSLEESIGRGIQLHPIIINRNNVLLSGRHRYEAGVRLGRVTISAKRVTCTAEQERGIIIDENNVRRKLSLQEKMFQINKYLAPFVKPVGHPKLISTNWYYLWDDLGEAAVAAGYFSSRTVYFRAADIVKRCIPDVIKAYDNNDISLYRAYQFALVKPLRQASLLTRMMAKRAAAANEPPRPRHAAAQRKAQTVDAAAQYAFPTRQEDMYEVVHIAPDWDAPCSLKNIKRLPVGAFVLSDAVVFLDCPARMFGLALEALDHWKMHYLGFFTVDSRNAPTLPLNFISRDQLCVVIGTADKNRPLETDGDRRIEPQHQADDPRGYVIRLLTEYFGEYMRGCMLDMTSTVPVDGWDVLELKFRRNSNVA